MKIQLSPLIAPAAPAVPPYLGAKVGFHRRGNRRKGGERFGPRRAVPSPLGLHVLISFACVPGGAALPDAPSMTLDFDWIVTHVPRRSWTRKPPSEARPKSEETTPGTGENVTMPRLLPEPLLITSPDHVPKLERPNKFQVNNNAPDIHPWQNPGRTLAPPHDLGHC